MFSEFNSHVKCPCGSIIVMGKRKYCTNKCYNKYTNRNSYESQKNKAKEMRDKIINSLGDKCSSCGYNKNQGALSIIPNDGKTLNFPFTITNLSNKSKLAIMRETRKCHLLCLNCEAEKNNPNPLP